MKYTIKKNDTLSHIGKRLGVSVDSLLAANPGIEPRRLKIGSEIDIPEKLSPRNEIPVTPFPIYPERSAPYAWGGSPWKTISGKTPPKKIPPGRKPTPLNMWQLISNTVLQPSPEMSREMKETLSPTASQLTNLLMMLPAGRGLSALSKFPALPMGALRNLGAQQRATGRIGLQQQTMGTRTARKLLKEMGGEEALDPLWVDAVIHGRPFNYLKNIP